MSLLLGIDYNIDLIILLSYTKDVVITKYWSWYWFNGLSHLLQRCRSVTPKTSRLPSFDHNIDVLHKSVDDSIFRLKVPRCSNIKANNRTYLFHGKNLRIPGSHWARFLLKVALVEITDAFSTISNRDTRLNPPIARNNEAIIASLCTVDWKPVPAEWQKFMQAAHCNRKVCRAYRGVRDTRAPEDHGWGIIRKIAAEKQIYDGTRREESGATWGVGAQFKFSSFVLFSSTGIAKRKYYTRTRQGKNK